MAAKLADLVLAGFSGSGNPATGAGLIGHQAVEMWNDGSIHFVDAANNHRIIHDCPELNVLLMSLVQGVGGVDPTKKFFV